MAWQTLTPRPSSRVDGGFVAHGGLLYACGGYDGSGRVANCDAYNPSTDSWSSIAALPKVIGDASLVSDGTTYLYLCGGSDTPGETSTTDLYRYDVAANTWTAKAAMGSARNIRGAGAFLNGKVIISGGRNSTGAAALSASEAYTPGTDTWAATAALPAVRMGLAVAGNDNGSYLYAVGGSNVQNGSTTNPALATLYRYDPIGDAWATLTAMPVARMYAAVGHIAGSLYVVGGVGPDIAGGSDISQGDLFAYDITTDTWTVLNDPIPSVGSAFGAVLGESFYVLRGSNLYRRGSTFSGIIPLLHIPHKAWATQQDKGRESQNYHALERWARQIRDHPDNPDVLHLPGKSWVGDNEGMTARQAAQERENYLAIERWAMQVRDVLRGV